MLRGAANEGAQARAEAAVSGTLRSRARAGCKVLSQAEVLPGQLTWYSFSLLDSASIAARRSRIASSSCARSHASGSGVVSRCQLRQGGTAGSLSISAYFFQGLGLCGLLFFLFWGLLFSGPCP